MRAIVRGTVVGAFSLAAVFGSVGIAAAGGQHQDNTDVDACQVVSCNLTNWNWNFSDDDTQGMNYGSVIG